MHHHQTRRDDSDDRERTEGGKEGRAPPLPLAQKGTRKKERAVSLFPSDLEKGQLNGGREGEAESLMSMEARKRQ